MNEAQAAYTIGGTILAILGVLFTLDKGYDLFAKWTGRAGAHNTAQDAQITQLRNEVNGIQEKLKAHDALFDSDNRRLKEIEECQRMQLRAIRALLAHGLDGNNTQAMSKSANEIDDYLYDRV